MVIMLCMKVWQAYQDSPVKPPVTFAMVAYNIAAHVYPALAMPFSLGQVCFSTGACWAAWCARDLVEVAVRTFGSVFTHAIQSESTDATFQVAKQKLVLACKPTRKKYG